MKFAIMKRFKYFRIQMGANHKSRVVLSMSAASALVDKLEGYLTFHDSTPEVSTTLLCEFNLKKTGSEA